MRKTDYLRKMVKKAEILKVGYFELPYEFKSKGDYEIPYANINIGEDGKIDGVTVWHNYLGDNDVVFTYQEFFPLRKIIPVQF